MMLFMSKDGEEFAKGLKEPSTSRPMQAAKTEIGKVVWIPGLVTNAVRQDLTLEMLIFHGYAEEDIFEVTNPNTDMKTKSRTWRCTDKQIVETDSFFF
jgi:hypothetical protein